jgi:hypothetical protein
MPTKRIIVTGGTGKAGHWLRSLWPYIDSRYRTALISNRRAKPLTGWKPEFYLR